MLKPSEVTENMKEAGTWHTYIDGHVSVEHVRRGDRQYIVLGLRLDPQPIEPTKTWTSISLADARTLLQVLEAMLHAVDNGDCDA